jgi:uncharacterized membrane protein
MHICCAMPARRAALVALIAAVLGLVFAAYSTYDYAEQLDRQVHAVHCSFIPGAPVSSDAENACKAALFSPYSAVFRASYWGGVPISLFGLGAFTFFVGFAVYLRLGDRALPRSAFPTFAALALGPLAVSLLMLGISLTHLHALCKLCVGIYVSSGVLVISAFLGMSAHAREVKAAAGSAAPGWWTPVIAVLALGTSALAPALVYVALLPDYRPLLNKCGKLATMSDPHHGLLKIPTLHPARPVLLFEDPLCPTCKAFHERLVDEGIFERLDVTMAMFPLDSDCNWMLDRALHPGACILARAVICGGSEKARSILEWAYDDQDALRALGKEGAAPLTAKISQRWGHEIGACVTGKQVESQLNQQLHFAASNHIPVSTPQMFLGDERICDEDTDLGLKYTLAQLAPETLP